MLTFNRLDLTVSAVEHAPMKLRVHFVRPVSYKHDESAAITGVGECHVYRP